jgi:hypothetical protein
MFGRPGVGDFNADGKPDIALVDGSPSTVTVMLGDGAGGFVQAPGPAASTGVTSAQPPVVADFNKDGKADLAVSSSSSVVILIGNGTGGFHPASSLIAGGARIVASDIDLDGNTDLVAFSGFVSILRGDGAGNFTVQTPPNLGSGGDMAVADFNGDGKPDIALNVFGSGVTVYFGDGQGGFTTGPLTGPYSANTLLFTSDFDLDGKPDIARSADGIDHGLVRFGLGISFGDGTGAFPRGVSLPIEGQGIAVADFNGDGRPDVASTTLQTNSRFGYTGIRNLLVHFGLGGGDFSLGYTGITVQPTAGAPGMNLHSLVASDLDLNGSPDVLMYGPLTSDPSVKVVARVQMNTCGSTAGSPRLTVNDVTARTAETTKMFFQVNLTPASSVPITVNYATADGTATAGTDYTGTSGSLTFAPGTTQAVVEATIRPQSAELSRAFSLVLTAPANASLAKASGTGSIINSVPRTPAAYVEDASVWEGNGEVTMLGFNVRLSEPSSTPITVDFATADGTAIAGVDYGAKSGTLTFTPGKTVRAVLVAIYGNASLQPARSLLVNLTTSSDIRIAKAQATGTILDDDPRMSAQTIDQYRLYSPVTGEHLYTTDSNEYSVLGTMGWTLEGKAYKMFKDSGWFGSSYTRPVYRLYNSRILQHHWTMDANEASTLASFDWDYEGIAGYMLSTQESGTVPLYRLMFAQPLLHLWTTDANEKTVLSTQRGWVYEGILGYVIP